MKSFIIGAEPYFEEYLKKEGIPFENLNLNKKYDVILANSLEKNNLKEKGLLIYLNKKSELKKTQKAIKIKPIKKLVLPNKNRFYSLNELVVDKTIPFRDEYNRKITDLIIEHCKENNLPFLRIWYFPRSKFIFSISHDTDFANDCKVEKVLDLEKKFNIKPTFFVHEPSLSEKCVRHLQNKGYFINSHIDLNRSLLSFHNVNINNSFLIPLKIFRFLNTRFKIPYPVLLKKFIQRLIKLEKINVGNRNHGLIWCNDFETLLTESGIKWDSSFGSSKYIGFSFETGLPFKIKSLIEIPLLIHDVAIIRHNLDYKNFIKETIEKEYFCNFNFSSHLIYSKSYKILEEFLELMSKNNILHMPLEEFSRWWMDREKLKITNICYNNKEIEFNINNSNLPSTILILTEHKKNSWIIGDNYFIPIKKLDHKSKCKLKE